MRIGVACVPGANAQYRAIEPMKAMARRGHEIVWPDETGHADLARFIGCDVVHVYRLTGPDTRRTIAQLVDRGMSITYDNDDDYTTVPKESPGYKESGGFVGQRIFQETVKMARLAHTFTTTNPVLAEKYRAEGVERTHIIENYLAPYSFAARPSHSGIIIGWVAALEHLADVARIPIRDALKRVVQEHDDVRVVSVGVNLGLSDRYEHVAPVDFLKLPGLTARFDIGIAPLADIPCNLARSNIKLKEYAACGVPWLASPVGPYAGLGEREGGRLVPDDRWYEALDDLIQQGRNRRRLAKKAMKWAKSQTIDVAADEWERVLTAAAAVNA